ncbi:protein-glutamine gamma-glutamyltransferase [Paenibacillus sp. 32O-W]|jgi:hypothetical protein|uniref:Protein-glutamine gamma-glutamyltransferase n=1 Tax=Paenibacillus cisolokensis TaxID=1658519 RepID=A0ABQ4N371_9BACL|nr:MULTISPECIES: protein-glutamine gamma-glutamyltransferase [Paenibacillus]ALS30196.1 protein-glutamine gamma-glutamyltransferase [Paenibacillus sp. 32O-W]GIQ62631.1 protein-glutamine gamma-glutamyltransferase [Paenibacillus cisolokensis]
MIIVPGLSEQQIVRLAQSDLERSMLRKKLGSPVVYRYSSPEALVFELNMRSRIAEASRAMNASGAAFAVFEYSRANPQYWSVDANGGIRLKSGVRPSDGLRDIFVNGRLYAFECATAMVIILYKATLDMIGNAAFDYYFPNLLLYDWQYDSDLRLITTNNLNEANIGDILYFKNPDFNPATPEWQGENAVVLGDNLYFGHGMGIRTGEAILETLNRRRRPGSVIPAYLTDTVLRPDFNYIRRLSGRTGSVIARIGSVSFAV